MPYYQKEIECASRNYLHAIQSAQLIKMVDIAYNRVPFYKKKLDRRGFRPRISARLTIFLNCRLRSRTTSGTTTPTGFSR